MELVIYLLKFINRIIPKNEHQIVFTSYPNNFSDNPKALYDYINSEFKEQYEMLWMVQRGVYEHYLNNSEFDVIKLSLKGLYKLFRSKFIITSNNSYATMSSSNQIFVNLWHGMPLKGMGFLDKFEDNYKYLKKVWNMDDIVVVTSPIMRNTISSCFTLDPRKIHITGQPRNDKLFSENGEKNLSKVFRVDISKYDKIILYCPTYRIWGSRLEGKLKREIFDFEDYDENEFNDFLKEKNILFLLKLHPFEEKYYLSKFKSHTNIKLLTSELFLSQFLDLYDILNSVDILITDYSSVYFDFLLLDRPILFAPTDIQEYSKRGFALEPYDFWTPGPKVFSLNELIKELKVFINNPEYYNKERKIVNDLVNKHKDAKSCERVWKLIKKLEDG